MLTHLFSLLSSPFHEIKAWGGFSSFAKDDEDLGCQQLGIVVGGLDLNFL